mmetsp:Transcript_23505/g.50977  ORF Transcript_23505/g.50977 Transcript_23505/m.50977 type:complete len:93 (-) Transcript_23505:92-370(-)
MFSVEIKGLAESCRRSSGTAIETLSPCSYKQEPKQQFLPRVVRFESVSVNIAITKLSHLASKEKDGTRWKPSTRALPNKQEPKERAIAFGGI